MSAPGTLTVAHRKDMGMFKSLPIQSDEITSDMHVSKDKVKHLHDPERFCPYIVIEMEISKQAEKRVVSGFDTATLGNDCLAYSSRLESLFYLHARGEFDSRGTWLYRFVAKYYVRQGVFKNFNSRLGCDH